MNRRGFLTSILVAATAPAIVRADSLMRIVAPTTFFLQWRVGTGPAIFERATSTWTQTEDGIFVPIPANVRNLRIWSAQLDGDQLRVLTCP